MIAIGNSASQHEITRGYFPAQIKFWDSKLVFDRETVIVLGAGASADFGFPLGEELRSQIIDGIGDLKESIDRSGFPSLNPTGDNNVHYFKKNRFSALASYICSPLAKQYLTGNLQPEQMINRLFEFYIDFKSQTHDTVDQFIWANPNHEFIGKILISQQIMLEMYEQEQNHLRLKSFGDRDYNGRRNWYQQLINLIRDGALDGQSLVNNKPHVVTFNYDHSLEQALKTSLADTEIHQGTEYTEVVSILHVNGTSSELPTNVTNVGKFILECAQDFHLVQETVSSEVKEVRAKARSAISKAVRIYLIGFHFDPPNVSAIGLREAPHKERVFCLNFNGHLGLKQKIMQLGIPESRISGGSRDAPRFINEALDDGFLEQ